MLDPEFVALASRHFRCSYDDVSIGTVSNKQFERQPDYLRRRRRHIFIRQCFVSILLVVPSEYNLADKSLVGRRPLDQDR